MARISSSGPSNNPEKRWDALRLGTSSSTSGSGPDKSGISGTTGLPSPAPSAESPSERDPLPRPPFSTATSTDGSGQETGSSPASPSGSSEGSATQRAAIPVPAPEADPIVTEAANLPSEQIMAMAREAYFSRNFELSDQLLNLAEDKGEDPTAVASARGYVRDARALAVATEPVGGDASGSGPSEEDPASGGMLVP